MVVETGGLVEVMVECMVVGTGGLAPFRYLF